MSPRFISTGSTSTICGQVRYEALPRFPAVERDFSFVFDDGVEFEKIHQSVTGLGIAELRSFVPVEIFRGEKVGARQVLDSDAGQAPVKRAHAARRRSGAVGDADCEGAGRAGRGAESVGLLIDESGSWHLPRPSQALAPVLVSLASISNLPLSCNVRASSVLIGESQSSWPSFFSCCRTRRPSRFGSLSVHNQMWHCGLRLLDSRGQPRAAVPR